MGEIQPPKGVKLIIGILSGYPDLFARAETTLVKKFGPFDLKSVILPFEHTRYYESQMGTHIKRQFLSFQRLIHPETIAPIKVWTNKLEAKIAVAHKPNGVHRPINLDPGYLTASKLVLVTTKDYSHRIYLRKGIYAEVTLRYLVARGDPAAEGEPRQRREEKPQTRLRREGSFQPWPWTYPDYKTREYLDFFHQVRGIYLEQVKPR